MRSAVRCTKVMTIAVFRGPGPGVAKIGDVETEIADGDVSIVPSGEFHKLPEHRAPEC